MWGKWHMKDATDTSRPLLTDLLCSCETQELNSSIDWEAWEAGVLPAVLAAHGVTARGGSGKDAAGTAAAVSGDASAEHPPVHPSLIKE